MSHTNFPTTFEIGDDMVATRGQRIFDDGPAFELTGGSSKSTKNNDLVDQLGTLDDLVFEAIAGRSGALDRLRAQWPQIKALVGAHLVEESREQYVRHALAVWRRSMAEGALGDPAQAIAALDVVAVLFDE